MESQISGDWVSADILVPECKIDQVGRKVAVKPDSKKISDAHRIQTEILPIFIFFTFRRLEIGNFVELIQLWKSW